MVEAVEQRVRVGPLGKERSSSWRRVLRPQRRGHPSLCSPELFAEGHGKAGPSLTFKATLTERYLDQAPSSGARSARRRFRRDAVHARAVDQGLEKPALDERAVVLVNGRKDREDLRAAQVEVALDRLREVAGSTCPCSSPGFSPTREPRRRRSRTCGLCYSPTSGSSSWARRSPPVRRRRPRSILLQGGDGVEARGLPCRVESEKTPTATENPSAFLFSAR